MENHVDILIVGGGPAGLTAAIYARRAGKSVLLLEQESFGGQIASAPLVENYPGVMKLSGAALAEQFYIQAEALGARIELERVTEIRDGRPKTVVTDYATYTADAVILATGMKRRTLDLPGQEHLAGISYCAVCDGAFYKDRDVAVCGGGSAALQDALFLSSLCCHVTLIHRRKDFRGDAMAMEALRARSNVTLCTETVITALTGETALSGLEMQNIPTGASSHLAVAALFVAVGQLPQTDLAAALKLTSPGDFLPGGTSAATALPGIFSAGDCREKAMRQLTTACADGAVAAMEAVHYCRGLT